MVLIPITLRQARIFIAEHHRHSEPPIGWLFGVGLSEGDELVGVGVAGRPVGRGAQDGRTVEITRTCTLGTPMANSMLYGALTRAAKALGYRHVITYKLVSEPGVSLKAAGFVKESDVPTRPWGCESRPRQDDTLFGSRRGAEDKERWGKYL